MPKQDSEEMLARTLLCRHSPFLSLAQDAGGHSHVSWYPKSSSSTRQSSAGRTGPQGACPGTWHLAQLPGAVPRAPLAGGSFWSESDTAHPVRAKCSARTGSVPPVTEGTCLEQGCTGGGGALANPAGAPRMLLGSVSPATRCTRGQTPPWATSPARSPAVLPQLLLPCSHRSEQPVGTWSCTAPSLPLARTALLQSKLYLDLKLQKRGWMEGQDAKRRGRKRSLG